MTLEDSINNIVVELGVKFIGEGEVADGKKYLRFRIIDRSKTHQSDVRAIVDALFQILLTSGDQSVVDAVGNVAGVILE